MTIRNLDKAFAPTSVALIGATPRPGSVGAKVLANLHSAGFKGPIWTVNPKYPSIDGERCFPSIKDLPDAPDLAIIATPPEAVPGLIGELGEKGTRAAVVLTAGIEEGNGLMQAMLDAARPYTLRIIGPNCFGIFLPHIGLNASFSHISPRPGRLALLSQSGAIASSIIDWAGNHAIGFSKIITLGNMGDVDVGDCLNQLATDRDTTAILMYLETVPHGRKFMSAARAASRAKPIVVVKAGRHAAAAKAALTHTGAISGADAVADAAFRRAGLLRVGQIEQLFDAAETLTRLKPTKSRRVAIVTNGGGVGVLAVDQLMDEGGVLAELSPETIEELDKVMPPTWSRTNPMDLIGDAPPERYVAATEAALADPNVDALLVLNCPTALSSADGAAEAVISTVKADRARHPYPKPVLTCWLGGETVMKARERLRAAGVATFLSPSDAIRSVGYLTDWHKAQALLMRTPPSLPDDFTWDAERARAVMVKAAEEGRSVLTEPEAKEVLAAFGIPIVKTVIARTIEEVEETARELLRDHKAVVVKLLSAEITHKSDVGGVVLNLSTPEEAVNAVRIITKRVERSRPDAHIEGFTVQPMIRRTAAHELIVGIGNDPLFGPTIVFGAGGTAVEVIADSATGLPPLDRNLARDLIEQTRISRLLDGYRDIPPADMNALELSLIRLSQMAVDLPSITSLDINPLLASSDGVVALDARVAFDPKQVHKSGPNRDMAIRPYPSGWDSTADLASGASVILRPLMPTDVHLYPEFLGKLSPEDIRMRFLAPLKTLPEEMIARLTQIDYARDMAFVALDPESGELLGVSRLAADPDHVEAEYAVTVRSDMKGRGIGWLLMKQIIEYAAADGIERLYGVILPENHTMLSMCRELGFVAVSSPEADGLRHVVIHLEAPASEEEAEASVGSQRPRLIPS
ncbi:bifunctional acetate--CoA ligase family protein/GNAT family N-acetyltransferase [Afifella aestuarii]|uniref:bifunctional acetate--CoA ligase family protein/GNAT family N-acetyltransferase n=1 Tax=Afifella aestuarii TaxID=1909496 RepID=UPI000FE34E1E|nr:bifunctional acetate--CoA ligase family protein/GNAT family N-acetyltransferase [Afifella aestuarii]